MGDLPIASALALAALDNTLLVIFIPTEASPFSPDLMLNFKSTLVITFITGRLESLHYLNKNDLFEDPRESWGINKFPVANYFFTSAINKLRLSVPLCNSFKVYIDIPDITRIQWPLWGLEFGN